MRQVPLDPTVAHFSRECFLDYPDNPVTVTANNSHHPYPLPFLYQQSPNFILVAARCQLRNDISQTPDRVCA